MALTELQLPTKETFYSKIQQCANQINNVTKNWADLAEFIDKVGTTELDDMGVPAGQIRTDLNKFRTMLGEMLDLYGGASVTPTDTPEDVIDLIRSI